MREEAANTLRMIHNLIGADELGALCDELYKNADEIVANGDVDNFLGVNYIFAVDSTIKFDLAVDMFVDFITQLFELNNCAPGLEELLESLNTKESKKRKILEQAKRAEEQRKKGGGPDLYLNIFKQNLDPERASNMGPYSTKGSAGSVVSALSLFATADLTQEDLYLETREMEEYLARLRSKNHRRVVLFRVPFQSQRYERVISRAFPVKVIHFTDGSALYAKKRFGMLAAKYRTMGEQIKSVVMGQDQAVNEVLQGLFSGEVEVSGEKRRAPKAHFLLMGSPGVGKTLIAKTIGDILQLPTLNLNMSDYADHLSYLDLVGTSTKFKNASEGKLVQFVRQNPESIVVFDEIEKAHITTIHLLLQILDMGILLDAYTEQYIEFGSTILFFTSNAGKTLYDDERNRELSRLPKKVLMDALVHEKNPATNEPFFPQAICSRMMAGNIVMLDRMDPQTLLAIAKTTMGKTVKNLEDAYKLKIELSEEIYPLFMYQEGEKIDARVASKKSADFIKREFYEISRLMKDSPELLREKDTIRFEVADEKNENRVLLQPDEKECSVLYIGKPPFETPADAGVNIRCETKKDAIADALKKDFSYIIIDPYLGYRKRENLCVNDIDSDGIRFFRDLVSKSIGLPIYIMDRNNDFTDTDKDSFALDGASGIIPAGNDAAEFFGFIRATARRHYIAQMHADFCSRGYSLDFTSRQVEDGNVLRIQFYDLKRRMTADAQSAKFMVAAAERPTVKLEDVIGAAEAKEELRYFTSFLKEPKKMLADGARAPRGLLLYGKPGTGKTMLAKALAGESDAAFISINASELLDPYRGEGEKKIRQIFATARRFAPAIIFVDEIDAIGKMRTGEKSGETVLNALLTEMDGFSTDSRKPVLVLAATNFGVSGDRDKKIPLDPALLRRFDNRIYVELPKEAERAQYLKLCRAKNKHALFSDEAIGNIAKRSIGKSIAELENIVRLAERNAKRSGGDITDALLLDAYEQLQYGVKKEQTEKHYRSTAIHEAGHAYIAHLSGNTPSYITITGRADFAGYVAPAINEEKGTYTEQEYRWMIRTKLAGRAAEKILIGKEESLNTGSSEDLAQATKQALDMVVRLGFVEGQMIALSYDYIDKFGIPEKYLQMANEIILEEQAACERLIEEGKDRILRLVDAVLRHNSLMTDAIRKVLDDK